MRWIVTSMLVLVFSCQEIPKDNKISESKFVKANTAIETIKQKAKKGILVCAHRSYHKNAPENSLESIRQAIENKIDIVEIDIRTTKDDYLVLMHDDSINRVANGHGKIKDFTFLELQNFRLKIGDSLTQHKIPLLSEALKISKGRIILNLDLKAVNFSKLHDTLKEFGMEHEVISFIGKKDKVFEMLSIDSLYATLPLSKKNNDIIFYGENTKSPLQHFTDETFTPDNIRLAKEMNQLIFVNTLWDEDDDFIIGNTDSMDNVIGLMPAIIQTDYPKLLLDYLRTKNLHD